MLSELSSQLKGAWNPVEVGRVNGHVLRLARFEGEYHWHSHPDSDELFIVLEGKISMRTSAGEILLGEGGGR